MRQRSGEAVPAVLRNFVGRQRPMEISSLSIILLLFLIFLVLVLGRKGFWWAVFLIVLIIAGGN